MQDNQKTFVSIIVPTYNRSATIDYCLKSLLNQTYQNFEIIIVDDCSTDNTVEVVNGIEEKRIRCIVLEKNSGAQVARNVGIKNSRYDWIAFQDSDDEWLLNKLELQIKELEKVNFDKQFVIHGNCNVFNYEKNHTTFLKLPITEGNCYKQLLYSAGPTFPSMLVSKEALERIRLLDINAPSYQEWDTSIRLAKSCKFIHVHEPLFIYHQHKGETISKDMQRDIIGVNYIRMKFRNEFINYYNESAFVDLLLTNIARTASHKGWDLGIQLLQQDSKFIPQIKYTYWILCLCFKFDPLKPTKGKLAIRKLFSRAIRRINRITFQWLKT